MTSSKEVWYALKEAIFSDEETRDQLLQTKKEIIKEYINNIKKENPSIEGIDEPLEKYLINDGSIKDVFQDIFRWCRISILLPESIDNLNKVKEKISWIQKVPTWEELSTLRSEILSISLRVQSNQTASQSQQTTTQWHQSSGTQEARRQRDIATISRLASQQATNNNHRETSIEIAEKENEFIKSVYERASKQIWKPYSRGGTSPNTWFDCSWLRYRAFKEEWINFSQRLTAHAFSDADVDIRKDQVKPWDFMFWDQKPWKKKHDSIYHIEMVISKPYTRNWKTYVRTLWSSTDAKDDRGNRVGKWVQIREREMKDYRHYWRPTYYYQLAQHQQTWSRDVLRAWANRPSQEMQNQILSA